MQDTQVLAESIVRNLLNLMRYSHRLGHRLRREYGISGRRLSVLRYLEQEGERSVSEISRYLNLRDGTVSPLLDCMVQEGLVTKRRCPDDSRRVLLAITDHGRHVAAQAPLTAFGLLRRDLPQLSPAELATIDNAVARVVELARVDESLTE
jgi:DNA-binding MarR family transcriptional regulator